MILGGKEYTAPETAKAVESGRVAHQASLASPLRWIKPHAEAARGQAVSLSIEVSVSHRTADG